MFSKKRVTAAALATLMASTSVASAAPAGNDVFTADRDNTVVNMTQTEMANTRGEFMCGGWCMVGIGAYTLGAGAAGYGAAYAIDNW